MLRKLARTDLAMKEFCQEKKEVLLFPRIFPDSDAAGVTCRLFGLYVCRLFLGQAPRKGET